MGSGNTRKFEVRLGQTGLAVLIVGMVVLLFLSFLFGVGVGKNIDTYPEKISSLPQKFLSLFWRPAKVAGEQKAVAGSSSKPDRGNVDLAFHQALTGSKTVPIQPRPDPDKTAEVEAFADKENRVSPPVPPQKEKAGPVRTESAGQKTAIGEKPSAEVALKGGKADSGAETYQVFVASLKEREKADQIHKIVTRAGYASKVVKVELKGKGTWYRVIATGFDTQAKAQAAADKLSKRAKTKCIVRPAATGKAANP
ncbi:MAG TPA: SPOR domain-containing protein [Smithellaceae bacterium]|nr:SPOR domain-containing protein [Smithellaceae bacterium]HRS83895.1 SPOR domain-containing protein [Smithellaceae bacterium]HRV45681.1 SPOR domain-containing protein [Smithellaceae bacterium]